MRRRDISKALFATATGSTVVAQRAQARTCTAPCYAQTAAEMAVVTAGGLPPINFSYPPCCPDRYATNVTPASTDMTAAINNAFKVATVANGGRGNTVQFLPTTYGISGTINAQSYCKMLGTLGETTLQGAPGDSGTKLLWIGSNISTYMLSCFNVRLFELEGIVLDGGSAGTNTLVNGILLDSNNNPSSSQNEFFRFSIRNCLLGVQWGTSGLSGAYANDGTRFSCFTIWSCIANAGGFVINSGNAAQISVIESGGIQCPGIGIDIVVSSYLQIRRVFGGNRMYPAFIRSATPFGILIEGCSSEGWGATGTQTASDSLFLHCIAWGGGGGAAAQVDQAITLIQNYILTPIVAETPVRIVSIGDTWGTCLSSVDHVTRIFATGTVRNFHSRGLSRVLQLNNGLTTTAIDITTDPTSGMPTQGWIDGAYVDLTIVDPGMGFYTPVFNAAIYTASGSMSWTVTSGEVTAFAWALINRLMKINFNLTNTTIGGTLSGTLRITIPGGKTISTGAKVPVLFTDAGTVNGVAICQANVGSTVIIFNRANLGNWLSGSLSLSGQIEFEVR